MTPRFGWRPCPYANRARAMSPIGCKADKLGQLGLAATAAFDPERSKCRMSCLFMTAPDEDRLTPP
jgi:hypothetical protein